MFAIIIPYFKLAFFRETLSSLAAQTDKNFRVYIGNDASPENPEPLIEEYKGRFDYTYQKFEENLGGVSLTGQWDRCIAMMEDEEWLMVLGDDDYLSPNAVEEFYKNVTIAEKEKISVMKLNSAIVDEKGTVISEKKPEPLIKSAIEHFFDKYIYEGRSSLSEHIFRKTAYEKSGFTAMPFAWHSDDLALLEFSEYGNIMFLEQGKCYFRISSQNISGNPDKNKKEKWQASKIFFEKICKNLRNFNNDQKRRLFNLIDWHENEKNIKIYIPGKLSKFYKVYGWKGIIKALR